MRIEVCDEPVFIVGSPRSGTSMLHWALIQHPALWGSEESDFMTTLLEALPRVHAAGTRRTERHWLSRQEVSLDELTRFVGLGVNALYSDRANGRRWLEQTPAYTLQLDSLAAMFPTARFLFLIRDGRQVVDSLQRFMGWSHRKSCKTWCYFVQHALRFESGAQGDRMLRVSFERLVGDTESELRACFEWLGLEPAPEAVTFVRDRPPINTTAETDAESSLDKLRPRWEHWSRRQRRTFARIGGDLLRQLGYEADDRWVDPPVTR